MRTKTFNQGGAISKKSLIVAAAITTLGVGGAMSLNGVVNAATDTTSSDPMSSLVQKIADKFNLNKSDVQAIFDQQRDEMETQREQAFKDRLAQAVKDGKLTQDQADKITAKAAELKANRDANRNKFKSMTEEERHAAMKSERDALDQWVNDNDIPTEYLHFGMRGHGGPPPADDAGSTN